MKQFTIEYENTAQLANRLDRISSWSQKNNITKTWIQVYVMEEKGESIMPISDTISFCMPDAKFMITHAGLAFASGSSYKADTIIVCNLFEEKDAMLELFQYSFTPDTYEKTVDEIIDYVNANPWVKLISINTGSPVDGIRYLDKLAKSISPDIVITGGAAITRATTLVQAKITSSGGGLSTTDLICTFVGGSNFNTEATVIVGWKGIGKEFTVTKTEGPILYELDNVPAFDIYKKYLKIESAPGMIVNNTIEFPLSYEKDDITYLRCPFVLNEDGSIALMMNDFKVGDRVKLAYGAPDMILDEVSTKLNEISAFEPQIVSVNSCLGRLFFWGDHISRELEFLQKITLSSGYLTGGEFLRKGDHMLILNQTIVVTAMREGNKSSDGSGIHTVSRGEKSNSLTQRLAAFIETVTADLEEYNRAVQKMAITDGLTGLNNRNEIERIIKNTAKDGKSFFLIMLDADYFKQINDIYGHEEGDNTLKLLSKYIQDLINESDEEIYAGRFGGDEFLIEVVGDNMDIPYKFASDLRERYNSREVFDKVQRTLSIGIAYSENETDAKEVFLKADEKLYEAKRNGRDCIVC